MRDTVRGDSEPGAEIEEVGGATFSVEREIDRAYRLHAARLKGFAMTLTRDPDAADDLVQEAFIKLVREMQAGRPPDNVGAWLHRVTGNAFISSRRKRTVFQRIVPRLVDRGEAPSPEEQVLRHDTNERLAAALGQLPEDGRVALLLAAQGLGSDEVGRAIGRTPLATRTYLSRMRVRLRDAVAELERERGPGE
jgi:RNA polymerase sigma-70 factor (ECF subfamily)